MFLEIVLGIFAHDLNGPLRAKTSSLFNRPKQFEKRKKSQCTIVSENMLNVYFVTNKHEVANEDIGKCTKITELR